MPVLVSNGYNADDIHTTTFSSSVKQVQDLSLAYMGVFIQEWRAAHPGVDAASNFTTSDPATLPRLEEFKPIVIPGDIKNKPPAPLPPYLQI